LPDSFLQRWVHVALITDSSNNMTFYVDGIPYGTSTFTGSFVDPGIQMAIGAVRNDSGNWNSYFNGELDEIAIWSRALHVNELKQIYRRGTNRIKYQVRICTTADCSDNPTWLGADNTKGSYFSEQYNTAPFNFETNNCSATHLILTGSPSLMFSCFTSALSNLSSQQYFQYRAVLESHDNSTMCDYGSGPTWCSPELKSVEIKP